MSDDAAAGVPGFERIRQTDLHDAGCVTLVYADDQTDMCGDSEAFPAGRVG